MSQFPDGLHVVDPDAILERADEATLVLVEPDLLQLAPSAGKSETRGGHGEVSIEDKTQIYHDQSKKFQLDYKNSSEMAKIMTQL